MMDADDRLAVLRGEMRERAAGLLEVALEVDRNPSAFGRHIGLDAFGYLATAFIPPEFNGAPLRIGRHRYYGMECRELAVAMEELAAGDAGMVIGAPGPLLSGIPIHDLADAKQKAYFYTRMLTRPTWTFFALTEPAGGSDATAVRTTLAPADGSAVRLSGVKCYIGNGARAELGVVLARASPGPLGVCAVLVDTATPGFTAVPQPTIGLRAAGLGQLIFNDVLLEPGRILGRQLPATRRGMVAAARMFNRARTLVGAMALGVARAAIDYAVANRTMPSAAERHAIEALAGSVETVRALVLAAATAADHDPAEGHLGSAAKLRAVRLAEEATACAVRLLGPGSRLEHPLLDKLVRDVRGFEVMEGTSHMQRLNLADALVRGRIGPAVLGPAVPGGEATGWREANERRRLACP
jgi:alkylation response protein AidB-like acyl-CoA dehydrogenase